MKDYENPFDDETVSYNEGLGDLLKEKPKVEFSLGKTILVLSAFVGVIALSVFAFLKLPKRLLFLYQTIKQRLLILKTLLKIMIVSRIIPVKKT